MIPEAAQISRTEVASYPFSENKLNALRRIRSGLGLLSVATMTLYVPYGTEVPDFLP